MGHVRTAGRVADGVCVLLCAPLWVPAVALGALLIVVFDGRPAFFRARRTGIAGRQFTLWKLRTMAPVGGPRISGPDDPRVTRVGRFLRRTRLDELPQLANVLLGDMALVGPRPEDPAFVDTADPRWLEILSRRPGLCSPVTLRFAAIEGRLLAGRKDPEAVYRRRILPRKLLLEGAYARARTPWTDLLCLARGAAYPAVGSSWTPWRTRR